MFDKKNIEIKQTMPSAFIQFSNEKRAQVKAENPKAGFGEMGKILGKMWKALSDDEKAKYVSSSKKPKKKMASKKAAETNDEKDAEDEEVAEDVQEEEEEAEDVVEPKKAKVSKMASKKKRAPSAFIVFSNKMRDEMKKANPNASFSELGKLLGKKWQSLSDQEKAAYKTGGRRGGRTKKKKY
jgi:hypothetical protein